MSFKYEGAAMELGERGRIGQAPARESEAETADSALARSRWRGRAWGPDSA